jgi:hypothetical protein
MIDPVENISRGLQVGEDRIACDYGATTPVMRGRLIRRQERE